MFSIIFRSSGYSPTIVMSEDIEDFKAKLSATANQIACNLNTSVNYRECKLSLYSLIAKAVISDSGEASDKLVSSDKVIQVKSTNLSLAKVTMDEKEFIIENVTSFEDLKEADLRVLYETFLKPVNHSNSITQNSKEVMITVRAKNKSSNENPSQIDQLPFENDKKDCETTKIDKKWIEETSTKLAVSMVQGLGDKLNVETIDDIVDKSISMALKIHNKTNDL